MSRCLCCYDEPITQVEYRLVGANEWKQTVYCEDCIRYQLSAKWRIVKESLEKMDCLAELRNVCARGIPLSMTEIDVVEVPLPKPSSPSPVEGKSQKATNARIALFRAGGEQISASLNPDITEEQRDSLLADYQELSQKSDVTEADIRAVYHKYWPEN